MAVLEVSRLCVQFGGLRAVRDVGFDVDAGAITGLIGPNGAGKTTIFNAVTGVQKCSGTVRLEGVDVSSASPHRRARMGMKRTFQRLEVFGSMTAFDNIRTAAELNVRMARKPREAAREITEEVIDLLGLQAIVGDRADSLPTGQARLVEFGRALATDPKVILLDEPASGLDDIETRRLAEVLTSLAAKDVAVLLVEHDIDLVMDRCSTIYVLNFGEVIAHGSPTEVRADREVMRAYLGEAS
ncbi:MAG: ABC transporter ATP-binding protein [Acidimicrobiales bacterium]